MANLITVPQEELENLPRRSRFEREYGHSFLHSYPFDKVDSFLHNNIGEDWDTVIHKFIHLKWLHPKYRTYSILAEYGVEVNTFEEHGEVYFYDNHSKNDAPVNIKDRHSYRREIFYVNPTNKKLAFYRPPKVKSVSDADQHMRIIAPMHQLIKVHGIWYEVKGKTRDGKPCLNPNKSLLWKPEVNHYYQTAELFQEIEIIFYRQANHKILTKYGVKNDLNLPTSDKVCPTCGSSKCYLHEGGKYYDLGLYRNRVSTAI